MAFKVRFYNFPKKPNSTAIPAQDAVYTEYDVVLKGHNSILSPEIVLDYGVAAAPGFNYCYIPLYDRYYFVTDWTWVQNRNWMASLRVDVLGTYRSAIGGTSFYVTRSATEYSPDIIDNLYPTKAGPTWGVEVGYGPWLPAVTTVLQTTTAKLNEGCFVVGMIGKKTGSAGNMVGATLYYLMSMAEMQTLINFLIGESEGFSISGVIGDVQKALVDPLQFITSVKWFPFPVDRFRRTAAIPVQCYTFLIKDSEGNTLSCPVLDNTVSMVGASITFTVAKHPQAASRGRFLQNQPFSEYRLYLPPFGVFNIDPSYLYNQTQIAAILNVDPIEGEGHLRITTGTDIIRYAVAQIAIDIPLAQISRDIVGSLLGSATAAVSSAAAFMSGNIPLAAVTGAAGIWSATQNMAPSPETSGSTGSFTSLCITDPKLFYRFSLLADEDLADNGRPLMEVHTPASIPGFMIVENGSISITGTSDEADMIRSYLESGFFYE